MTDYTVNPLNQAAWLVYINGLEIPIMGVTTNWGVWQMPTATIQMVPHPMLQRIGFEDRLQVVVFYLDEFWYADNPQFCLLGEFEVVGWSYMNSARGRAIQLECVSHDQILEQLHFYYISSLDDIIGSEVGEASQNPANFQSNKLIYPACLFLEGLTTPINAIEGKDLDELVEEDKATNPGLIKRPIDFVTNIFRSILTKINFNAPSLLETDQDGTLPPGAVSAPSKNFFARWMLMTQYHKRWFALPGLEDKKEETCFPILKAVQDTETLKAVQQEMGQRVGESGSAWDLLQYVFGGMYMEIAMIPSPSLAVVDKTTGIVQTAMPTPSASQFNCIMSRFVKPQCFFSLPPTCNVIFPSMTESFTVRETYITQPTRLYLGEDFISNYLNTAQNAPLSTLSRQLLQTGYPKGVRKRMSDLVASPGPNNKSFLLFPEEFFKGPVATRLNAPPWMYSIWQNQKAGAAMEGAEADALAEYSDEAAAMEDDASVLGSIFDAYAEYEFYRARYAERQGGISTAWNPYIVPGFPVAIFDQLNAGFHCMAYVNSIAHTFSAASPPSLGTMINLSFIRTMPEFMGIMGDSTSYSQDIDIAPVEIIPEIRDQFQIAANAQNIYEKLFYRGMVLNGPAVFNWRDMVSLTTWDGQAVDPQSETFKFGYDLKINPLPAYKPLFDSYASAMKYVSRPVCTLREYIETYHSRPMADLLADGTVRGEYRSFYSVTRDKNKTEGAVFWGRIYKLIPGPGMDPGVNVSNIGPGPDYAAATGNTLEVVDRTAGMAETRKDWDLILEEYRKIIRSEEGKVAPQV